MKKDTGFPQGFFRFKERKHRKSLTLIFSLLVFVVLLAAILLATAAVYVLVYFGVIGGMDADLNLALVVLLMSAISIVIGTVLSFFFSKVPLKPINELINKMNRLAAGDFRVRLEFRAPLDNHPTFREISTSFNRMAEELEQTELLRSDFINNFSHEFKTPIVSIAGFAKLLYKGNLPEEQKRQYLRSIEEEAMRLSDMATNVLNLTKVENQTILTETTRFNLSEQIRSAVLLLEGKWSRKDIELSLEFDEYEIEANEELLKQIWINLIDNAVKFTPQAGTVSVQIAQDINTISVSVGNTGSEIPAEKMEKIFHKFYQAEESHSAAGNGVGLAIVKKITELHKGAVAVESGGGVTTFTVVLPKEQK